MARRFYDPSIVIEIARKEIGYIEKKSAKDLDDKTANAGDRNYTKYARDLDNIKDFYNGRKQGICGWCDIYVDWCFVQAYGATEGRELLCQPLKSCGAGPYYSMQYFKAKKQLVTDPQPGDQIFFYPTSGGTKPSHTGLVVAVDDKYVHTIEGNTSANGVSGCVAEKQYARNNTRIAGYGRPDWGEVPDEEPDEDTGEIDPSMPEPAGVEVALHDGPGEWYDVVDTADGELDVIGIMGNGWVAIDYGDRVLWCDPEDVEIVARGVKRERDDDV